jgi:hypothetical protein
VRSSYGELRPAAWQPYWCRGEVQDGVRTGERLQTEWLLCRQLGLEAADDWKIRAEVLARDASRLGTANAVRDGDEAARLPLGPATARWSAGTSDGSEPAARVEVQPR